MAAVGAIVDAWIPGSDAPVRHRRGHELVRVGAAHLAVAGNVVVPPLDVHPVLPVLLSRRV